MRRIFSTAINSNGVNIWLFIARMTTGAFMLTHGLPKLQNLLAGKMQFADPIGIGSTPSFILVIFAEVICSLLLILGFATRFASLVLIINMSVAAFVALADQPFGKKELPLLFLLLFIGFLILGGGKYALDSFITKKSRSRY
jgi:putative oxidoreductase